MWLCPRTMLDLQKYGLCFHFDETAGHLPGLYVLRKFWYISLKINTYVSSKLVVTGSLRHILSGVVKWSDVIKRRRGFPLPFLWCSASLQLQLRQHVLYTPSNIVLSGVLVHVRLLPVLIWRNFTRRLIESGFDIWWLLHRMVTKSHHWRTLT